MARDRGGGHGVSTYLVVAWLLMCSGCSRAGEGRECTTISRCRPAFNIEWAAGTRADEGAAARLANIARRESHTQLAELDPGTAPVKFTVVSELAGSDAVTFADERRIVLAAAWLSKREEELSPLIAHELAHIAIGTIPGYQGIPLWLQEGVAEMAAGRVRCEVSVDLGALQALGYDVRAALHDSSGPPTAIQYKIYGAFTAYIAAASRESVVRLLADITRRGVEPVLKRETGRGLQVLERDWLTGLPSQQATNECESRNESLRDR